MGEDLSLPGREAIRTPMQWSLLPNAGFSSAPAGRLIRPVVSRGEYGYKKVNVTAQRRDPESLLAWFERMIRTLREAPEIGSGDCSHVDVPCPPGVLAHCARGTTGTMLFLHNLGNRPATVNLGCLAGEAEQPNDVLADQDYGDPGDLSGLKLAGYGYRWIRLRRTP